MILELENPQVEYLLGVLTQRPLGEALALFESIRAQMRAEMDRQRAQAGAGEPSGARVLPMHQQDHGAPLAAS